MDEQCHPTQVTEIPGDIVPTWVPPEFNLQRDPQLPFAAQADSALRAPAALALAAAPPNFYRSAKWSPDGSCALTADESITCRIHRLKATDGVTSLDTTCTLPQPAPILDGVWYPGASIQSPETFCFVASVRNCPVKLLDASSGRLRASYRIVDHRERFVAPHSMAFDPTMTKLYCGCVDFIEIFDLQQPGDGVRLATTPSKKSRDGLKGIISAISFCSDYSGLYAAATYSTTPNAIALFDPEVGESGDVRPGGVTQLLFHPTQPHILFAASRRSPVVQVWDLRNPLCVAAELDRWTSEGKLTNQRLKFDVDLGGSGLQLAGWLSIFDVSNGLSFNTEPVLKFRAHNDAIGSVSFHPIQSLALTVSGSRHFDVTSPALPPSRPASTTDMTSDSGSDSSLDEELENNGIIVHDPTIKLWNFSPQSTIPHSPK
ncbi:WD40-repeat-containing domain protein [Cantharellus anzutake]|uniref:WD40-repeat-containing domain protein n=1 Tax=Cantharellus anzutake TaxID=1750568 RepID=UPI001906497C|nr:WD40-repeat-containing domain protein [Cantharellus anzutake]KAF8315780.1 WD40-repeat-containing domain protein [Cantharellus anzutake]